MEFGDQIADMQGGTSRDYKYKTRYSGEAVGYYHKYKRTTNDEKHLTINAGVMGSIPIRPTKIRCKITPRGPPRGLVFGRVNSR